MKKLTHKLENARRDMECDLELSKGDKFPHVHVSTYSLKTRKTTNYRINCDDYEEFDGHCTHAEPAGGKIILVNFMCTACVC